MASWLVLDWDHDQFYLLSAQSSRRGVQIMKAATWAHPEPFTPSTAERIGKALREFLKTAKIAAAPVIVGLGRDRIFVKELRVPPIEPHEEAALVRFQTGKELAESVDSYAVDYVRMNEGPGERQIMTVAARRDMVAMVQTLCQAAGLKLHALTPRLFGIGYALAQAVQPDPSPLTANRLNVVLSIGQRWAELCFFRGERLLQAQALANGPLLTSEVKRNVAVFAAQQAANLDLSGPECLYVFGDDPATLQSLESGQALPVRSLNPLRQAPDEVAGLKTPGYFAGGVGLAALFSHAAQKPVNLAAPKRMQAPVSVTKQRGIFYGSAAAVVFLLAFAGMYYVLATKRAEIDRLTAEKKDYDDNLTKFAQERADLDAYKDWEQTTVPWLDEMYDLTARYPYGIGFRVTQFSADSVRTKKNAKDGFIGKISLNIVTPKAKDKDYMSRLQSSMAHDPHVRPSLDSVKGVEYQMKIDIAKQDAKKYTTKLDVPPQPIAPAVIAEPKMTPDAEEGDEQ